MLEIEDLSVSFRTKNGLFTAVDGFSLNLRANEIVSIVGESGSGKSVAMLALMGLLPKTAVVKAKVMRFDGRDLLSLSPQGRRTIIGKEIAMIFQDPMTSLNPCFTVSFQIGEVLKTHLGLTGVACKTRILELLHQVGITDPERRLDAFPHQLSGGMSQRVMIAMALACGPKLLIADEPSTALDVTIQAQILDLLRRLRDETGMALVLITHDMGVVAETAERVIVQYAGRQVEQNDTIGLFADPHHPYTAGLLAALPERNLGQKRLSTIPGVVPGQFNRPQGCLFAPRCVFAQALCHKKTPEKASPSAGLALCFTPLHHGVPQEVKRGAS